MVRKFTCHDWPAAVGATSLVAGRISTSPVTSSLIEGSWMASDAVWLTRSNRSSMDSPDCSGMAKSTTARDQSCEKFVITPAEPFGTVTTSPEGVRILVARKVKATTVPSMSPEVPSKLT